MNHNYWYGEKIVLRSVAQKDLDAALTDPYIFDTEEERSISEIPFPSTPEQDRSQMAEMLKREPGDDSFFWEIDNVEGEHVGFIHTWECKPRMGTFRYAMAIHRPYRRRGYAQEAVCLVLRYYFRELRYQKCTVNIYAFNETSLRFHRSFGFVEEGRLRRMVFTNGEYFDEIHMGMTREEFDAIDPPLPFSA